MTFTVSDDHEEECGQGDDGSTNANQDIEIVMDVVNQASSLQVCYLSKANTREGGGYSTSPCH